MVVVVLLLTITATARGAVSPIECRYADSFVGADLTGSVSHLRMYATVLPDFVIATIANATDCSGVTFASASATSVIGPLMVVFFKFLFKFLCRRT